MRERSALSELTVSPPVRMLDFPAFTHMLQATNTSLLALRAEMAFQRFPALVVAFIEAVGGLEAPFGDSETEG